MAVAPGFDRLMAAPEDLVADFAVNLSRKAVR